MSSYIHHFDTTIAKKYGVNVAIFLSNIAHWIGVNAANKTNFHDGRYWTYNKQDSFLLLFDYWSKQTLRTTIDKCLKYKLIHIGNYNDTKYDRTNWYALTDLGISLFPKLLEIQNAVIHSICGNQQMEKCKSTNHKVEINISSIADINPDKKPDNSEGVIPEWLDKKLWDEFRQHRKDVKKRLTPLAEKKLILKLEKLIKDGHDPVEVINESIANGWTGLFEVRKKSNSKNSSSQTITKDVNQCTGCKRPINYCQCNIPSFDRESGQQGIKTVIEMMKQKGIIVQKGV